MNHARRSTALILLVIFVAWWFAVPSWLGFLTTVGLARGLGVLGIALLMRAGLVSFGQGLFFAAGGYAAGFSIKYWHLHDALALIGLGLAAGIAVAIVTGLLIARYREIFFAMLTLGFSMMLYGILVKGYTTTGGSQGMGIPSGTLFGFSLQSGMVLYFLTLGCAAIVTYVAYRFTQAPLGYLSHAVRDNEIRVGYLGASVQRTVLLTFVLAGAAAGLGGALDALAVGHIDPTLAYWTTSGEFVFVALLSGAGSVLAPIVGSVIFEILQSYALAWFPQYWQIVLGAVLLIFVLFLPGGLWTLYERGEWTVQTLLTRALAPSGASSGPRRRGT